MTLDKLSIIGLKLLKLATVSVASVMVVGSSYVAWDMRHTEKAAFSSYDLSQYRPQVEAGEPATLDAVREINDDAIAWLTIYDTHIDYPVTQGKDDLEYVNKDIYGKTTPTGSIYLTSQNSRDFSDPYNLMYGHHMDNGGMFGDVDDFQKEGFFNAHTDGVLITPDQVYDLDLIASIEDYATNRTIYSPKRTGLGILDYIMPNAVQKRSADGAVKVLALSTCDYERTNGRDLVYFKMTPHEGPYEHDIEDTKVPLIGHGDNYWALLNLLCMIVTVYNLIPLHVLRSKFGRKKVMKDRNKLFEEESEDVPPETFREKLDAWLSDNGFKDADEEDVISFFDTKKFGKKTVSGSGLETIVALASLIAFILTEDMRLPIRIIDKWTPLMLALLFISWLIDVRLLRLKLAGDEEEKENEDTE